MNTAGCVFWSMVLICMSILSAVVFQDGQDTMWVVITVVGIFFATWITYIIQVAPKRKLLIAALIGVALVWVYYVVLILGELAR